MCKRNYAKHVVKRPELATQYFRDEIEEAITDPEIVYTDLSNAERVCFYKIEYESQGRKSYVKVIIAHQENPKSIITAYRVDVIKESKFNKPICNPLTSK